MKSILLIGLGRFGQQIAKRLNELNQQVMAVDSDEERVNAISDWVTNAQIGNCTNEAFLSSLGISNYDTCIVAIGDDFQSSLETSSLLKDLGAKKVIARAATGIQEKFLLRNGADQVVYPEKQLANWTAIRCISDHILDYIELEGDYSIFELAIPEKWSGKTILQLDIRKKYQINVLAVRESGQLDLNIGPDTLLTSSKSILVLASQRAIQKCFRL